MARIQPIHVRDMTSLLLELGIDSPHTTGEEVDAVGSQCPTALELFRTLRDVVHAQNTFPTCTIVPSHILSPRIITYLTKPLDWYTGDILLDADDLDLMYSGLTLPDNPSDERIPTRMGILDWIQSEHIGPFLGETYVNSIQRYYYDRKS
mmetsp:Transcript_10586/g.14936  ORF Transcript_10586/g.14936 Transcript_10586/m.14936 type:complete len:150 (-) Transcript_10586:617-1066(-)